jgi:hypothetical protein
VAGCEKIVSNWLFQKGKSGPVPQCPSRRDQMLIGENIRSFLLLIFLATCLTSCGSDTSISIKSWTHPTDLRNDSISPAGQQASDHQAAMDENGNAIITWVQFDGVQTNVYVSEFRNKKWVHPAFLTDKFNPGTGALNPAVALNDKGRAIIAWSQFDGSSGQIFKSEYIDKNWIHPASLDDHVNPNAQIWANHVRVATGNNDAIIIWRQFDGQNHQIYKSEYRNGIWVHPASLTDHVSQAGKDTDINSHQIAMDDNGNAIIVWVQSSGIDWVIFKSEYRNGTWSHPMSLSDFISFNGYQTSAPQIAMDNNGDAIIVWQQNTDDSIQIFKSEYRNNTWNHPTSLSERISQKVYSGDWALNPQVDMNDLGTAIICWQQKDSAKGSMNIYKSEYRNNAWINPVDLNENINPLGGLVDLAEFPQIALDNNDNAIIVWRQYVDFHQQVFKSEFRNRSWLHPRSINDYISPGGQSADSPKVAMGNNGDAMIVWQQSDGTSTQVFMSEYR